MLPIKDFPLFEGISTLLTRSASYVFSVKVKSSKSSVKVLQARGKRNCVFD
jgi:hypothetical protein